MDVGWSCPGGEACRHLRDEMTGQDVARTLGAAAWRWRWLTMGLPDAAADVVAPHLAALGASLGAPGVAVDRLQEATDAVDGPAAIADAWHAGEHIFTAAARALAEAGLIVPQAGVVTGLFLGKGLPKQPVDSAEVWRRGLVGDVQRERKHHGRPSQALCIWSAEVVDALVAEGHPITPGAAGENVSIRGVDWSLVRPGSLLRIGSVECEISGWALPCAKNRKWFRPGVGEQRIDPDAHPGWSRAYAYVLASQHRGVDGELHLGDEVAIS
jgi:MOSC domain-containing protein YiiM